MQIPTDVRWLQWNYSVRYSESIQSINQSIVRELAVRGDLELHWSPPVLKPPVWFSPQVLQTVEARRVNKTYFRAFRVDDEGEDDNEKLVAERRWILF